VHSGSLIANGGNPKTVWAECSTLSLAVLLLFIHIRLCLELKTLPKVLSRYPKVVHGEFLKAKMDYKIVIIILGYSSLEKQRNKKLQNFQRSHDGERPYQCVPCSSTFGLLSSLKKHQKFHINKVRSTTDIQFIDYQCIGSDKLKISQCKEY
jgi:hypothetical protein